MSASMLSVLRLNMAIDIPNSNQSSIRNGARSRNNLYLPNYLIYSFYLEISTLQLIRMAHGRYGHAIEKNFTQFRYPSSVRKL